MKESNLFLSFIVLLILMNISPATFFSNNILGNTLCILIILVFSYMNIHLGLFACLLIVYMKRHISDIEGFDDINSLITSTTSNTSSPANTLLADTVNNTPTIPSYNVNGTITPKIFLTSSNGIYKFGISEDGKRLEILKNGSVTFFIDLPTPSGKPATSNAINFNSKSDLANALGNVGTFSQGLNVINTNNGNNSLWNLNNEYSRFPNNFLGGISAKPKYTASRMTMGDDGRLRIYDNFGHCFWALPGPKYYINSGSGIISEDLTFTLKLNDNTIITITELIGADYNYINDDFDYFFQISKNRSILFRFSEKKLDTLLANGKLFKNIKAGVIINNKIINSIPNYNNNFNINTLQYKSGIQYNSNRISIDPILDNNTFLLKFMIDNNFNNKRNLVIVDKKDNRKIANVTTYRETTESTGVVFDADIPSFYIKLLKSNNNNDIIWNYYDIYGNKSKSTSYITYMVLELDGYVRFYDKYNITSKPNSPNGTWDLNDKIAKWRLPGPSPEIEALIPPVNIGNINAEYELYYDGFMRLCKILFIKYSREHDEFQYYLNFSDNDYGYYIHESTLLELSKQDKFRKKYVYQLTDKVEVRIKKRDVNNTPVLEDTTINTTGSWIQVTITSISGNTYTVLTNDTYPISNGSSQVNRISFTSVPSKFIRKYIETSIGTPANVFIAINDASTSGITPSPTTP